MKSRCNVCAAALVMMALCALFLGTAFGDSRMMSVQVREGQVRQTPSFLGKVVGGLKYGDRVQVAEESRGWAKVSGAGASGWVHLSALSEKKIVFEAGAADAETGASSEEVALAGKGFNKQVESEYQSRNPQMRYDLVDQLEGLSASAEDVRVFLEKGAVKSGEGN